MIQIRWTPAEWELFSRPIHPVTDTGKMGVLLRGSDRQSVPSYATYNDLLALQLDRPLRSRRGGRR